MSTKIEWADITINPVVGCSKCSPGCDHCYAERFAARLAKTPATAKKYAGVVDVQGKWTGNFNVDLTPFDSLPRKSKRIFVGSMCDIFHEKASYNWFLWIVRRMSQYPQHTFVLLTKRPERMDEFISLTRETDTDCGLWPLPNVLLGVTVCNQAEAEAKIPVLLQTPAAKRFVSIEPMLGPVDLHKITGKFFDDKESNRRIFSRFSDELDWVICGGETGPGARPMHPDWVRGLRDQCVAGSVPFFFKGWGGWAPAFHQPDGGYKFNPDVDIPDGLRADCWVNYKHPSIRMCRVGELRSGRLLDGVEYSELPEA